MHQPENRPIRAGFHAPYAAKLKKSVTMRLSENIIDYFKQMADEKGVPYQGPSIFICGTVFRVIDRLIFPGIQPPDSPRRAMALHHFRPKSRQAPGSMRFADCTLPMGVQLNSPATLFDLRIRNTKVTI